MDSRTPVKRINILVSEKQYDRMTKAGLNISAFVRDLIEDHFSEHVISLSVSKKTHDLYNTVISSTGATDADLEPLFVELLRNILDKQIKKIKALQEELNKEFRGN